MDNTQQLNPDLGTIAWSAFFIEKVHRCADCPIRRLGTKHPQSVFARIHSWHKTWWPGWMAHQAKTCAFYNKPIPQA
jgi:hypothetical protein